MGKIVTIYLSNEEAKDLKAFCDENQCTQYSALKTAVRQILSEPLQPDEMEVPLEVLDDSSEDYMQIEDVPEEFFEEPVEEVDEDKSETSDDTLRRLLLRLRKARENSQ